MKKTTRLSFRQLYIWLLVLVGTTVSNAQCPTPVQNTQSFCDSQAPTVAMLEANANGATMAWYASETSTTPLSTTAGLVHGATYWLGSPGSSCVRRPVQVTIYGPPMGNPFQGVCVQAADEARISDLFAFGNDVKWYDAMIGGNPLPLDHIITSGTIYYASQTNPITGCETSRLGVFASVQLLAAPTGSPVQTFCNDPLNPPTVSNLVPNGPGYRWFATSSSSVPLAGSTVLVDGESYFATTYDPPCESSSRLEVLVDLVPANNAGSNASLSICLNTLANQSPINLFQELGGNPQPGGIWSGPIATNNGHLGTVDITGLTVEGGPYVFTYTVSSDLCPSKSATVTLEVLPLPLVGISSNKNICSGEEATVIFTGTPGALVGYNLNGGPTQTLVIGPDGTATLVQTYTETTTVNLISATNTGDQGCTVVLSESLEVQVTQLPNATLSAPTSVCQNALTQVTFSGTPNAQVFYTVNGGSLQSIVLDASGSAILDQSFAANTRFTLVEVSTVGIPVCTRSLNQIVEISVVLPPVVSISSSQTLCYGDAATVTFTGTPNAVVTYLENGLTQTLTLNSSGTYTLTRNFTLDTTYELVEISTTGDTICTQPVSGTVIITVLPEPTATISPDQVVCEGLPATVNFTGTPNATVRYQANAGAIQSVVLDENGNASVTQIFTESTTLTLLDITTLGTPSCTATLNGSVLVELAPVPTVALSENQEACAGDTVTVTFTGTPLAQIEFTVNGTSESITLNNSGSAQWTGTVNSTTVIALVSATSAGTPSCTIPVSGTLTIQVTPPPTVTLASSQTICEGETATLTFTGTPNALVSYTINGGAVQTLQLNAQGLASITNTYTLTTTFEIVGITSEDTVCVIPVSDTATITVQELPIASVSNGTTICENESATLVFTGTPNAQVDFLINGVATSITLDSAGLAEWTQVYTETSTIVLQSVRWSGVMDCERPLNQTVIINVIALPDAAITQNSTICPGDEATFQITGTPNAVVRYTVGNGPIQSVNLGASGSYSFTSVFSETTVIQLIDVTAQDLNSCVRTLDASITISIVPLPVVTIASDQTLCENQQATITFTGTPNSTVVYTENGTTAQIILDATGNAQIEKNFVETTVYELVSATMNEAPGCFQPISGSATIRIQEPTTATISGDIAICSGEEATLTLIGTPGSTVTYTVNGATQTAVIPESGTLLITQTFTQTTVFELVSSSAGEAPGCVQPLTGQATVTLIPPPVASITADPEICIGDAAAITITGTPGALVTFAFTNAAPQTVLIPASGTYSFTSAFTENTTVQLISIEMSETGSCVQPIEGVATVVVRPIPQAEMQLLNASTLCQGEQSQIQFTGTPGTWITYSIGNGTNQTVLLDAEGRAIVSPILEETATVTLISVHWENLPTCIQTIGTSETIEIVPLPNAGADNGSLLLCELDAPVDLFTLLGSEAQTGGTWSPALSSGSGIFNPAVDTSGIYTYTIDGQSVCPSASAQVIVTVQPASNAGEDAVVAVCSSGASVDLFQQLGPNAQVGGSWNPSLSGGSIFNPNVDVAGTYTYTVNGVGECPSDTATVTVSIIQGPNAGEDANIAFCSNGTASDLFAALMGTPQAGGTWSPALASGSGIFNPAVDNAGVYTYTVTGNSDCPEDTARVTVSITPAPNAGTDAVVEVCSNGDAISLFDLLGNEAQTGGTWSPNLENGIFNPVVNPAGVYTYTVGGNADCPDAIAQVTVNLLPGPNAGQDGNAVICESASLTNLFDSLQGTPQPGGTWSPALASGNGNFNPAVDAPGIYTYTVTGNADCPAASASVTVTLAPASNAGENASLNLCSNQDPVDLFLSLGPNAQQGGTWSPALTDGMFNPATQTSGVYTYTVSGADCPDATAQITITVTPGPDAGEDGTLTLCTNSAPQDLFNALNGTPLVGGTWSPSLASGNGIFNPAVDTAGVYTYTFSGNDPCDNDTALVTVVVNPIPDAGQDAQVILCSNQGTVDLITLLEGTPQPGGTWSPVLQSGTSIFDPEVDAAGTYTYSVGGGFCDTATASLTITIQQSPQAGGDGTLEVCNTQTAVDLTQGLVGNFQNGTWSDDDNSGSLNGNQFNASQAGPGTYHFTHTVTGGVSPCVSDTAIVTVVVEQAPNSGVATMGTFCEQELVYDLHQLLEGEDMDGVWTDATGNTIDNTVALNQLTIGNHLFTYTVTNSCATVQTEVQVQINPLPQLTSAQLQATSPVCLGAGVTVAVEGLADGNYTIVYDIEGSNTSTGHSANFVMQGGNGSFVIPSAVVTNAGNSTLVIHSILESNTQCNSDLVGVSASFTIIDLPVFTGADLSADSVCFGNDVAVTLNNATQIANGTYIVGYSLIGNTTIDGFTSPIGISNGFTQFTIPAAMLPAAGTYQLVLNSLNNGLDCVSNSTQVSTTLTLYPIPDLSGANLIVGNVCTGSDAEAIITDATSMPDGIYEITYELTGAAVGTYTAIIEFIGGDGSFSIPSAQMQAIGSVQLVVTDIVFPGSTCLAPATITLNDTFEISQVNAPQLSESGQDFCERDMPTLAHLSANLVGQPVVIWYDAPTGGTAYSANTPLIHGQTYYAAGVHASGCESAIRLAVTVDLTVCNEILIPDGFSPNADGINDTFHIVNLLEIYPNYKLEIYNRYGNIVYKGNAQTPEWDGTSNQGGITVGNGVLPVGVYFYILEFNDGERKPIQGRVYLSR